ncbi:Hypothetical protein R9X50_00701200 [Acrodontium crateriforme]|uniref:Uncharacterized protein n=1 Tax=Acrodontium crateriforme TaxID=150365 RepID=A0AAQ3MDN7_9PEZI|nr:Hypothetical protein R9X50_00701200 [Acrodontium crateriforme]
MTDIQQWRRMIQPVRARTPMVEQDDNEDATTSPRRLLKPKFSSYFTAYGSSGNATKVATPVEEPSGGLYGLWRHDGPNPEPNADGLMDSVMCRLLGKPYDVLDVSFHGAILRIFESYRCISDENQRLQAQVAEQEIGQKALFEQMRSAQQQWHEERKEYKAEVKRLELLLAKGKRGLAEVTLARQDSVFRQRKSANITPKEGYDDGLETIFEFLEKTKRYEDKAWSSQRAAFRSRPVSPSRQMRRLSQQLASKMSMTNIHAELPFGTPPDVPRSKLVEATLEEIEAAESFHKPTGLKPPEPRASFSDDTGSTFSCLGDLLPDETTVESSGSASENESAAIKRIANVHARRRNLDQTKLLPKLMGLFDETSESQNLAVPPAVMIERPLPSLAKPALGDSKVVQSSPITNQPSLRAKASVFLQRIKPTVSGEQSMPSGKRFSFEAGDDAHTLQESLNGDKPATEGRPPIRKSFSLSSLSALTHVAAQIKTESTVSPVNQIPRSERRVSKIPTPVHSFTLKARPRRKRETSSSSLVTAIQCPEGVSLRSNSISSSVYSSPTASIADLRHQPQCVGTWTRQVKVPSNVCSERMASRGHSIFGTVNPNNEVTNSPTRRATSRRYLDATGMMQNENTRPDSPTRRDSVEARS